MSNLITVASFNFPARAQAHKLFLEREGIRVFVADETVVGMDWALANAIGGVKLQVAAEDAERAMRLLEQFREEKTSEPEKSSREDIAFACDSCGKNISFPTDRGGHVETCPRCGKYVDVPDAVAEPSPAESENASTASPAGKTAVECAKTLEPDSRKPLYVWLEVLAVLCLVYVPYMYSALHSFIWGRPAPGTFLSHEAHMIIVALQTSMPLLLIMALSKDSWSKFGIVRPLWIADAIGGLAVFLTAEMARAFTSSFLATYLPKNSHGFHAVRWEIPHGVFPYAILVIGLILSPFSEELAMRGFLIPRLERLLKSSRAAVIVSALLFASYHLYQGVPATFVVAATGLVYGIGFCFLRRLWPLCLAHTLHNLLIYL